MILSALCADLVFDTTLAHKGTGVPLFARVTLLPLINGRCDLLLECAMLTAKAAYVGPFDRICHGLGGEPPQLPPHKAHRFYQIDMKIRRL